MRHAVAGKRLGRNTSHRRALLRNLATSLILHERIQTTDAKAKELRKVVERMITLGKRGDLHARRLAASFIIGKEAVQKLFDIAPRFNDKNGGYTRIVKVGRRLGDAAPVSMIELIGAPKKELKKEEERPA
jgi:large subunit ribosomal protein L17